MISHFESNLKRGVEVGRINPELLTYDFKTITQAIKPERDHQLAYDIAEAVIYLIAPSGKFVTGEVLTVDGGNQQWGDVWPAGRTMRSLLMSSSRPKRSKTRFIIQ